MLAAVKEVLAERTFDVAHVAGWSIAGLAPALAPLPAVLTTLDAIHVNYRARSDRLRFPMKPLLRIEAARVGRFEARAYRDYNAVVVVSGEDERSLRRLDPELPVRVIPNGVDADRYSPRPDARREPGLVVFTGAMDWHPNVAAACFLAQEVMPRVLERCPDARLALVGRSPSREVSALAAPGTVEVTGEVPDIGEWLRRAHAYACPMVSGTGIKNKLLEAMACACACVATARACQGLDVRHGRELLVGETADEIAAALADVLEDEQLAARVGSAGREYVLRSHSWSGVADAYERLLREACEGSAAAPSVVT